MYDAVYGANGKIRNNFSTNSLPNASTATEVIIAYEPLWAVGTSRIADIDHIQNSVYVIRNAFKKLIDWINGQNANTNVNLRVVYGGSVNGSNYKDVLSISSLDGVMVGSESLVIDKFSKLVFS